MTRQLKPLLPYALGGLVAAILFVFPDAKPIACGLGFALPAVWSA